MIEEKRCSKGHPMRRGEDEFDPEWICDRCDDAAIDRANERAEWRYYHGEG